MAQQMSKNEAFTSAAVRQERERCAKIADGFAKQGDWDVETAECIAASIRADGDPEKERLSAIE